MRPTPIIISPPTPRRPSAPGHPHPEPQKVYTGTSFPTLRAQDAEGLPFHSGTKGQTQERLSSEEEGSQREKEEWYSHSRR